VNDVEKKEEKKKRGQKRRQVNFVFRIPAQYTWLRQ
jgi:hypothetical protein